MNKETREKLFEEARPIIQKIAYKSIGYFKDLELGDLIQEFSLIIWKEIPNWKKYKPKDLRVLKRRKDMGYPTNFKTWVYHRCERRSKELWSKDLTKKYREIDKSKWDWDKEKEKGDYFETLISTKSLKRHIKTPEEVYIEKENFKKREKELNKEEKEKKLKIKMGIPLVIYKEAALDFIFRKRYGIKPTCPKCGKIGFHRIKKRKCYSCARCGYQIHPLAGTIFHKSSTPLNDWLFAMYLIQNEKNISIKEIQRRIKVTYKTAWRITHKIREMQNMPEYGNIFENLTYIH